MMLAGLVQGRFLKRYKRFFVDVELAEGKVVTAHCNNTGSMKSLLQSGCPVWMQYHGDPKRKLKYTLHLMQMPTGALVCVNTLIPNQIVFEAIKNEKIPAFRHADSLKKEVSFGQENSRVDLYLEKAGQSTFIEIKNTTLAEEMRPGIAQFPDAITERGRKHLSELSYEAGKGHRAVIFFLVNRTDCHSFQVAEHIDPLYANALQDALERGVEIQIHQTRIEICQDQALIEINRPLSVTQ